MQNEETRTPRRPLRRVMWLVTAPLAVLLLAAGIGQFVLARSVHADVQRLFEELREVDLARTLLDELRGAQQWVVTAPQANAAEAPLALADARRHHAAALATLRRFQSHGDPSRKGHEDNEDRLVERVRLALDAAAAPLAAGAPLGDLARPIDEALHHATVLIRAIEDETREIGDHLERRSADVAQFVVLLGLVSVATLAGMAWLLLRRVLRPVRELREAAIRLGRGELGTHVPVHHADELGDLALTFRAMAQKVRSSHDELERRVEERSREVLRTAHLAQLGTLAAGIAHEINNPLASIVAGTDGLLRELDHSGRDDPPTRDYLQLLRKEAMRARDITVRLLRFARQEGARREPVALAAELQEVAALFAHQLADAGVLLRIVGADLAPLVLGDPAELRQVLFNLLRNALDASPRGGTITASFATDVDEVVLRIADEGPGIPAELQDRVFEPFFTTKEPGRGTGLGLSIVHRIVTSHGGRVHAGNGSRGAVLAVHLPIAR